MWKLTVTRDGQVMAIEVGSTKRPSFEVLDEVKDEVRQLVGDFVRDPLELTVRVEKA